jgi:phosphoserine phosphatase
VDDVEERLVAGADDAVGEVVRVRVAPLAGDRVDRLDLVRAELVQPLVRQGHDLVLAHARLECLDDVLVDPVDHRGGLVEQHDLVV